MLRIPHPPQEELRRWIQTTGDAPIRTRLAIVLHCHRGWGAHRIAAALGCVPGTPVRVGNRFLEQGVEGLLDGRLENGTPKVDEEFLQALADLVLASPPDHGFRDEWRRMGGPRSRGWKCGIPDPRSGSGADGAGSRLTRGVARIRGGGAA